MEKSVIFRPNLKREKIMYLIELGYIVDWEFQKKFDQLIDYKQKEVYDTKSFFLELTDEELLELFNHIKS